MKLSKLQWFYLEMAVLGFIGTEVMYYQYFAIHGPTLTNVLQDVVASESAIFMLIEVSVLLVVCLVWMKREASRLGMGRYWVYFVLSLMPSPAVGLPLFLLMRERKLNDGGLVGQGAGMGVGMQDAAVLNR